MLRVKLPPAWRDRVRVQSAGTLGIYGSPATPFAVEVAAEHGADISGHRSQGVSRELVKAADIILAMAPEHKAYLERHHPDVRENVFLLRAFGRKRSRADTGGIADPIGGGLEVYRECGEAIAAELDRILPRLMSLIEQKLGAE